jgi:hypothetical protein
MILASMTGLYQYLSQIEPLTEDFILRNASRFLWGCNEARNLRKMGSNLSKNQLPASQERQESGATGGRNRLCRWVLLTRWLVEFYRFGRRPDFPITHDARIS